MSTGHFAVRPVSGARRTARRAAPILALGACLALFGSAARAGVIVVAADGSGSFTSINAAALAAASGDTLLVRPGVYSGFGVGVNKSVTVTADGDGPVVILGVIGVVNTLPGTTVVISGLTATGSVGSAGPVQGHPFVASGCAGPVRVQNCSFTGAAGDPDGWLVDFNFNFEVTGHAAGWHAALVQNCSGSVSFNDCVFHGGAGTDMTSFSTTDCGCTSGEPGGDAVHIINSRVALTNCVGTSGAGAHADRDGGDGGSGVAVESGEVHMSGSQLTGGAGGAATDYIGSVFGGDGGDGVSAAPGASVTLLDSPLAGGAGGPSLSGDVGAPGEAIGGAGAGDVVLFTGESRHLGVSAPAFVGGSVTVSIDGKPGDLFVLLLSTGNGWLPLDTFHGVVSVALPAIGLGLGALPASGHVELTSSVPAIAPLVALDVSLQAIGGTSADASVTGQSVLIVIDPAGL